MATDAEVLNALRTKLAMYEGAGMVDHAKRVKARIAELEKGGRKTPGELPMALNPVPNTPLPVLGATVTKTVKPTVKKAKKAAPKTARKK